jgi:hypothetical protein
MTPPRIDRSTQAGLLAWSANAAARLTAAPESFGESRASAAAFAVLADDFAALTAVAANRATRSPDALQAKQVARGALKSAIRVLIRRVEHAPGTTDAHRAELGIPIRPPRVDRWLDAA